MWECVQKFVAYRTTTSRVIAISLTDVFLLHTRYIASSNRRLLTLKYQDSIREPLKSIDNGPNLRIMLVWDFKKLRK